MEYLKQGLQLTDGIFECMDEMDDGTTYTGSNLEGPTRGLGELHGCCPEISPNSCPLRRRGNPGDVLFYAAPANNS